MNVRSSVLRLLRSASSASLPGSPQEILASKLATLLERSEIRDLADVKALLDAGGDLQAGLRDAPKKDAGFSPLTLAWVLKDYDPRPAVKALGWDDRQAEELLSFRQWLIDRLTAITVPDWPRQSAEAPTPPSSSASRGPRRRERSTSLPWTFRPRRRSRRNPWWARPP